MPDENENPLFEFARQLIAYLHELARRKIPEKLTDESPQSKTVNELIDRHHRQEELNIPEEPIEMPDDEDSGGIDESVLDDKINDAVAMQSTLQPTPKPQQYILPMETFWAKITQEASGGGGEYDGWAQQKLDSDGAWENDNGGYGSEWEHGSLFEATATEAVPLNTIVCVHEEYNADGDRRFVFDYNQPFVIEFGKPVSSPAANATYITLAPCAEDGTDNELAHLKVLAAGDRSVEPVDEKGWTTGTVLAFMRLSKTVTVGEDEIDGILLGPPAELPMDPTEGDLLIRGADVLAWLGVGTTGQILGSSGGLPAWEDHVVDPDTDEKVKVDSADDAAFLADQISGDAFWIATQTSKYVVTGTLSPDATGIYCEAGTHNGEPYYKRTDGAFVIWWDTNFWVITNELGDYTLAYWENLDTPKIVGPCEATAPSTGEAVIAAVTAAQRKVYVRHIGEGTVTNPQVMLPSPEDGTNITAQTDTWDITDQDDDKDGFIIPITRLGYYSSGGVANLYYLRRDLTCDRNGHPIALSAETLVATWPMFVPP